MAAEDAADLAAMFGTDDFAELVTYTPPGGGSAQSVAVIWDDGARPDRMPEGGQVVARRRSCRVPKAAFSPSPLQGGTIARGAVSHRIRTIEDDPEDPSGKVYLLVLALSA